MQAFALFDNLSAAEKRMIYGYTNGLIRDVH